jgi:hypothetical protein
MHEPKRRRSLPSWARKVIVALIALFATILDFLVDSDPDAALQTRLLSSLSVGLIVALFAALFETQFTINEAVDDARQALVANQEEIQREVGGVSQLNKLRDRISSQFGDAFLMSEIVDYEWARFVGRLESLANGALESKGFEALINAAVEERSGCTRLYGVTTLPTTVDEEFWWREKGGRHYSRLNYELVKRARSQDSPFPVVRIWVYKDDDDPWGAYRDLLAEQVEHGVRVRLYKWKGDAIVPNFTIWNSETAWEAKLNWDREMIAGTYYASKDEVRRLRIQWERLMRESVDWTIPSVVNDSFTRAAWVGDKGAFSSVSASMLNNDEIALDITDWLPEHDCGTPWLKPLLLDVNAVSAHDSAGDIAGGVNSAFTALLPVTERAGSSKNYAPPVDGAGWLIIRRFMSRAHDWAGGQQVEIFSVWASGKDGEQLTFTRREEPRLYQLLDDN